MSNSLAEEHLKRAEELKDDKTLYECRTGNMRTGKTTVKKMTASELHKLAAKEISRRFKNA